MNQMETMQFDRTKYSKLNKSGFHSGPAVGGIVGAKNVQYCLFGDTVNTASRITTTGEPGRIHLSDTSYLLLKDSPYFEIQVKGKTELKGKGIVETYWLVGPKSNYTAAIEQDAFRNYDDEHSAVGQHQATMYEASNKSPFEENQAEDRSTPTKRSTNAINRLTPANGGQCPFSGMKLGGETST